MTRVKPPGEWPEVDPPPEVPTQEEIELADTLRHDLEERYLGDRAPELPTLEEIELADELRYEAEFRHLGRTAFATGETPAAASGWRTATDD
jgi:hypothetical protein